MEQNFKFIKKESTNDVADYKNKFNIKSFHIEINIDKNEELKCGEPKSIEINKSTCTDSYLSTMQVEENCHNLSCAKKEARNAHKNIIIKRTEKSEKITEKTPFEEGEKILCYHGPLIYEAKCLHVKKGDLNEYYIHYRGWNLKWDEWVSEDRILKYNDENLEKKKALQQKKQKLQKKIGKRKLGVSSVSEKKGCNSGPNFAKFTSGQKTIANEEKQDLIYLLRKLQKKIGERKVSVSSVSVEENCNSGYNSPKTTPARKSITKAEKQDLNRSRLSKIKKTEHSWGKKKRDLELEIKNLKLQNAVLLKKLQGL